MAAPASAASSTPVSTSVPRAGISELWHDKAAAIGLAFILLIVFLALFAPLFAPYDRRTVDHGTAEAAVWMERGTSEHLLGTDQSLPRTSCPASSGAQGDADDRRVTCLLAATLGTVIGLCRLHGRAHGLDLDASGRHSVSFPASFSSSSSSRFWAALDACCGPVGDELDGLCPARAWHRLVNRVRPLYVEAAEVIGFVLHGSSSGISCRTSSRRC